MRLNEFTYLKLLFNGYIAATVPDLKSENPTRKTTIKTQFDPVPLTIVKLNRYTVMA